jgi:hypothetical protein
MRNVTLPAGTRAGMPLKPKSTARIEYVVAAAPDAEEMTIAAVEARAPKARSTRTRYRVISAPFEWNYKRVEDYCKS